MHWVNIHKQGRVKEEEREEERKGERRKKREPDIQSASCNTSHVLVMGRFFWWIRFCWRLQVLVHFVVGKFRITNFKLTKWKESAFRFKINFPRSGCVLRSGKIFCKTLQRNRRERRGKVFDLNYLCTKSKGKSRHTKRYRKSARRGPYIGKDCYKDAWSKHQPEYTSWDCKVKFEFRREGEQAQVQKSCRAKRKQRRQKEKEKEKGKEREGEGEREREKEKANLRRARLTLATHALFSFGFFTDPVDRIWKEKERNGTESCNIHTQSEEP